MSRWFQYQNPIFHYKTQNYINSCFPCCMHMSLENLGITHRQNDNDSSLEVAWQNHLIQAPHFLDLNHGPPNEDQVHECVARLTPRGCSANFCFPSMLTDGNNALRVAMDLATLFLQTSGPRALIFGVAHARVFYKFADNTYLYISPNDDETEITIAPFDNLDLEVLPDTTQMQWRLKITGQPYNDSVDFVDGEYIMHIHP